MSTNWRTLVGALVFVAAAGAASEMREALPQAGTKPDQTASMVCGADQSLSGAIPVTAANTILAGDGRLYVPCPTAGGHGPEHRESRETAELYEALRSNEGELRWRAAQALVRIALQRSEETPTEKLNVPIVRMQVGPVVVWVDGIGALTHSPLVHGVCRGEAQVFDATTDAKRWDPGRFFDLLRDLPTTPVRAGVVPPNSNNPQVRSEAAYALGVRLSRTGLDENLITAASRELQACFRVAEQLKDWNLAGLILEDVGVTRYARDEQIAEAESFLVGQAHELVGESHATSLLLLYGATKGLEALYRHHAQYSIRQGALLAVRQLARYGAQGNQGMTVHSDAGVRRLALMALQAARDHDTATLRAAALDGDWQNRRIVAGSLNLSDPEQARLGEILREDSAFQVRYDVLAAVSRQVRLTHQCGPLVPYFKDVSPAVVMRAMDLLAATCADLDDAVAKLIDFADKLKKEDGAYDWHTAVRALAVLARLKPDAAHDRLAAAAKHATWQVRAAVAAATVDSGDAALAAALARDTEPNVQTAALDALFRLRSTDVVPAAIEVLSHAEDYQALRMAAMVLKGLPADAREAASDALITALRKLTDDESDTSRESRIAIVERLAETLDPGRSFLLVPFATGFDDQVNAAVLKTISALGGFLPSDPPKRRYPYQPTSGYPDKADGGLVAASPKTASLELDEGAVGLILLSDVAPVTVARFVELADRGYYNGLTFHRVVTNFFVQGGSPGANDYSGVSRYMRDEVGPQGIHVRGAVGMMTRGGDTGNGQIFIDLVDAPALDREYTVFAYVTSGMEVIDRLLEGSKIKGVTVR